MMDLRKAAVPALIFVGGALLAGCGDATTDDEMESTTDPLMEDTMEDDMMEEDVMSPSP